MSTSLKWFKQRLDRTTLLDRRETLNRAIVDKDPQIRLYALEQLGRNFFRHLRMFFEDELNPAPLRVRALQRLAEGHGKSSGAKIVATGILDEAPEVKKAAIEIFGRWHKASLEQLAQERTNVQETLLTMSEIEPQTLLLALLEHENLDIKVASAELLGVVGAQKALDYLKPFTRGFFVHRGLKSSAKRAVESIDVRITTSQREARAKAKGAVSLAKPDEGRLSFTDKKGAISTPEES